MEDAQCVHEQSLSSLFFPTLILTPMIVDAFSSPSIPLLCVSLSLSILVLHASLDSPFYIRLCPFDFSFPFSFSCSSPFLSLTTYTYVCPFRNPLVDLQSIFRWIISQTATSSVTGPLVASAIAMLRAFSQPPNGNQQERRRPPRRENIDTPAHVSIDKDQFFSLSLSLHPNTLLVGHKPIVDRQADVSHLQRVKKKLHHCHRFHLDQSWPIFSNHWKWNFHVQQSYLCQPNDVPVFPSSRRWSTDGHRCFTGVHLIHTTRLQSRTDQHCTLPSDLPFSSSSSSSSVGSSQWTVSSIILAWKEEDLHIETYVIRRCQLFAQSSNDHQQHRQQ